MWTLNAQVIYLKLEDQELEEGQVQNLRSDFKKSGCCVDES